MYPNYPEPLITLSEIVADQVRLLEFIEKMNSCCLHLIDAAAFSRPFFDRLAEIGSSIRSVTFNAANLITEPGALEFLFRMTELSKVVVQNCPLNLTESLDLAIAAFERIKKSIYFLAFDWGYHFHFTLI